MKSDLNFIPLSVHIEFAMESSESSVRYTSRLNICWLNSLTSRWDIESGFSPMLVNISRLAGSDTPLASISRFMPRHIGDSAILSLFNEFSSFRYILNANPLWISTILCWRSLKRYVEYSFSFLGKVSVRTLTMASVVCDLMLDIGVTDPTCFSASCTDFVAVMLRPHPTHIVIRIRINMRICIFPGENRMFCMFMDVI